MAILAHSRDCARIGSPLTFLVLARNDETGKGHTTTYYSGRLDYLGEALDISLSRNKSVADEFVKACQKRLRKTAPLFFVLGGAPSKAH